MRTGRHVGFAPGAAGSLTRDAVWTYEVSPAPRQAAPKGDLETAPNLAELGWATVKVRMALEELTIAAQAAAEGARAIVEVMDAAAAVLDGAERPSGSAPPSSVVARQGGGLSPREREVLALVAEGRSNKAIAEALYISPNTIKTHIASLMTKLQADSRAQLAAIAARQEVCLKEASKLRDMDVLAS
jgi:DNA-binding CsgD family transcriptional regulator